VQALSMPNSGMPLLEHDAALLAGCEGLRRWVDPERFSSQLRDWLHTAVSDLPEGAFLRLGGRSFVTEARGPQRVRTVAEALDVLAAPGERAGRMARRCILAGRPVWLFARAWRSIKPEEEFRLWIHQRRLVAASQHHFRHCFPGLAEHGDELAEAVADFAQRLCACLHLPDVVADVWLRLDAEPACELIELNPAMRVTGRGLLGDRPVAELPRALHLLETDAGVAVFALPD
jgi:hypothetical protein